MSSKPFCRCVIFPIGSLDEQIDPMMMMPRFLESTRPGPYESDVRKGCVRSSVMSWTRRALHSVAMIQLFYVHRSCICCWADGALPQKHLKLLRTRKVETARLGRLRARARPPRLPSAFCIWLISSFTPHASDSSIFPFPIAWPLYLSRAR